MKTSTSPPVGVLVSGGLDSAVLTAELAARAKKVYPLFIRQNLRWEMVELIWLRRFLSAIARRSLQPLVTLEMPMQDVYGEHWSTGQGDVPSGKTHDDAVYLPGRNLTILSKAAVFCERHGVSHLAIGPLSGNPFPDARPPFFKAMSRALTLGLGRSFTVTAPFRDLSKAEVIRRGQRWPLDLTFSCLQPQGTLHCGACNKCEERRRAFRAARVVDKTMYAHHG